MLKKPLKDRFDTYGHPCTVVVFLSNSPIASMASDFNFQFTRVQKTSIILKNMNSCNNFGLILKKGIPDCNHQAQKEHFYFFSLCFDTSNFQEIGVWKSLISPFNQHNPLRFQHFWVFLISDFISYQYQKPIQTWSDQKYLFLNWISIKFTNKVSYFIPLPFDKFFKTGLFSHQTTIVQWWSFEILQ